MEWFQLLAGYGLGLLSSILVLWVQGRWQANRETRSCRQIVGYLIGEIDEAITRAQEMAELAHKSVGLYSRIYVALWESTRQRLAESLDDPAVLHLLHRIYYRIDLMNFMSESHEYGRAGGFANTYLPEIRVDFEKLKAIAAEW